MIKLENKKSSTIVYEQEDYALAEHPRTIKVVVSKQNGKIVNDHIYLKKSDYPIKSKREIDYNDDFRFYYFKEEIFDECKKKHFTEIKFEKFIIPFNKYRKESGIHLDRILCPYNAGHMIFRAVDSYPIPTVQYFDYIGAISNEEYDIDKALKHLSKHPFVIEVEKEEIPYYNRSENRTHGLKMNVLISDKVSNKIWDIVKKAEFPSCEYHRAICCNYWNNNDIDPLGIRQFYIEEKDRKHTTEDAQDDENEE